MSHNVCSPSTMADDSCLLKYIEIVPVSGGSQPESANSSQCCLLKVSHVVTAYCL